jgi:DNA-binding NarL/FixJ family response regulator
MSPVRLLIADHEATRQGIKLVLEEVVDVCAEAGDSNEAVEAAARTLPDVCIVGLELPGDALNAVRGLGEVAPKAKVIVMAPKANPEALLAVIRAGAIGYLVGNTSSEGLRRTVVAAAAGEAAIPRAMVIELARELRGGSVTDGVSPRAAQVLELLRKGCSTANIADTLGISPVTVRRHISILMQRTGVNTRAGLAGADLRDAPAVGAASG